MLDRHSHLWLKRAQLHRRPRQVASVAPSGRKEENDECCYTALVLAMSTGGLWGWEQRNDRQKFSVEEAPRRLPVYLTLSGCACRA